MEQAGTIVGTHTTTFEEFMLEVEQLDRDDEAGIALICQRAITEGVFASFIPRVPGLLESFKPAHENPEFIVTAPKAYPASHKLQTGEDPTESELNSYCFEVAAKTIRDVRVFETALSMGMREAVLGLFLELLSPEELNQDPYFEILNRCQPAALLQNPVRLKEDRALMLKLIPFHPYLYFFLGQTLQRDRSMALLSVEHGISLEAVPQEFRGEREFIESAKLKNSIEDSKRLLEQFWTYFSPITPALFYSLSSPEDFRPLQKVGDNSVGPIPDSRAASADNQPYAVVKTSVHGEVSCRKEEVTHQLRFAVDCLAKQVEKALLSDHQETVSDIRSLVVQFRACYDKFLAERL